MADLHVLRVFTDEQGRHGNPLGVFAAGGVDAARRQPTAAELGFSETAFVEDAAEGRMSIFTPTQELPLAGHPLVGTAWLLRQLGHDVARLRPPAGEVAVRTEGAMTWVRTQPRWAPAFELRRLGEPADVESQRADPDAMLDVWAWQDEAAGVIRSRVFAGAAGVPEDEATGSAAMLLVHQIGRPVTIRQGRGSVIEARPLAGGAVEIGGRVVLDEVRGWPPRGGGRAERARQAG